MYGRYYVASVVLVHVPGQARGVHCCGEGDGLGQGQDGEVVPDHIIIIMVIIVTRSYWVVTES